jgi:hypothetical protein
MHTNSSSFLDNIMLTTIVNLAPLHPRPEGAPQIVLGHEDAHVHSRDRKGGRNHIAPMDQASAERKLPPSRYIPYRAALIGKLGKTAAEI